MKRRSTHLVRATIIALLVTNTVAFGQDLVIDQFDFQNRLANPFVDGWIGADYLFQNPVWPMDYEYFVPFGTVFNIDALGFPNLDPNQGVRIQLADGVSIRILGQIACIGFDVQRNIIEAAPGGGRWNEIIIDGDPAVPNQGQFAETDVSGGGGNLGNGLLRLRDDHPILSLVDCYLFDSENHGIVFEGFNTIQPTLILDQTRIGWQPFAVTILGDGICYEGNINLLSTILINESSISWCGGFGLGCSNVTEQLTIDADVSWFSSNGRDGVLVACLPGANFELGASFTNCVANSNGIRIPVGGFGVHVTNALDEDGSSNINIVESSQVDWNYSGGVRIEGCEMTVNINHSEICDNGTAILPGQLGDLLSPRAGSGIYISQYNCAPSELILDNTISRNGHEGIFLFHGPFGGRTSIIRGNRIEDNAVAIDNFEPGNPELLPPLREGASIYLLGSPSHTQISNNYIIGGMSGIVMDGAGDYLDMLQDIRVTSNVQRSAHVGFLMVDCRDQAGTPCVINNNIFAFNDHAGALILSPMMATAQLSSCVFYQNAGLGGWGIRYVAGGNPPNYNFNCYWQNGQNPAFTGCASQPHMNLDPLFINPADGQIEGWHVSWNSPLINRGNNGANDAQGLPFADMPGVLRTLEISQVDPWLPADVTAHMDNTRNDIGTFGGRDCAWPVDAANSPMRPLTWDPYVKIDANHAQLHDDLLVIDDPDNPNDWVEYGADAGFDLMEADYYCGFVDYQVPINTELNIAEGAYFDNKVSVDFIVNGELHAGNFEQASEWIYFTGYLSPFGIAERWSGIRFNASANINSTLEKVYIRHSTSRGIYINGLQSQDPDLRLQIHNCSVSDCDDYGIYIYNSHVKVYGQENIDRDMELPIGSHFPDMENRIRSIRSGTNGRGIYIYGFPGGKHTLIEGTNIYDCGTPTPNLYSTNCGLYLYSASPILLNTTICNNGNVGVYMNRSDWGPILPLEEPGEIPDSWSNDVYRNGQSLPAQTGINGAEIYLAHSSYPDICYNDIQDFEWNGDFQGDPLEGDELIYKNPTYNPGGLWWSLYDYWGYDDQNEQIRVLIDNRMFDNEESGQDEINFNWDWMWSDSHLEWSPIETDNVTLYRQGMILYESGEIEDAFELFRRSISEEFQTADGIRSLQMIPACVERLEIAADSGATYLLTIAETHEGTEVGYNARLLSPYIYQQAGSINEAIRSYDVIIDQPQDELQAVEAELLKLRLMESTQLNEGHEIDQDGDFGAKIATLENRIEQLESASPAGMKTPNQFMLAQAYPNPFNNTTTINFFIPSNGNIEFKVYDLSGRSVFASTEDSAPVGWHRLSWNAQDLPTGFYFGEVRFAGQRKQIRLLLMK